MKNNLILAVVALVAGLSAAPAMAAEGSTVPAVKIPWSFSGPFGTYDVNQLQRGFQIFRDVCSSCHGAEYLAFRNLAEPGGPGFTEDQVDALAATYQVADPTVEGGMRPAIAADRFPSPLTTADAIATFGVVPPDFSVLAKARTINEVFPFWVFNYFTAYSEGGADYIYNLLNGYHDTVPATAPEDFELAEGKYYNDFFPGHSIGMPPQLADGEVVYESADFPQTREQYSQDIAAFMYWLADPHMVARKETGFKVIIFLLLFAGIMWFVKRQVWRGIEH